MHPKRKRRLSFILLILFGLFIAVFLALFALRQNINLFYTPSQVAKGVVPIKRLVRLGGVVKKHSFHHENHSLSSQFLITDYAHEVMVRYTGILPDLFREGQAVVVAGLINSQGQFIAKQVLAKHDATYMPQSVKNAILQAKKNKAQGIIKNVGDTYAT